MYRIFGSSWPDIRPFFSNPVPDPVPAKMVPGIRYLSRIVLGLFGTYLGPPASSVPSERLFSTAGGVITERRARLLSDNAESLIFLKYNASLIKSE